MQQSAKAKPVAVRLPENRVAASGLDVLVGVGPVRLRGQCEQCRRAAVRTVHRLGQEEERPRRKRRAEKVVERPHWDTGAAAEEREPDRGKRRA